MDNRYDRPPAAKKYPDDAQILSHINCKFCGRPIHWEHLVLLRNCHALPDEPTFYAHHVCAEKAPLETLDLVVITRDMPEAGWFWPVCTSKQLRTGLFRQLTNSSIV